MHIKTGAYDTPRVSKYKRHEPVALSWLPEILVVTLIPLTAVNTAILHSLLSSIALASILLIVTIILFCTGQYRLQAPHKWIGTMGASVLLAYLIPQVRLESSGQPLEALTWLLLGYGSCRS
jgi:hypothetical protein